MIHFCRLFFTFLQTALLLKGGAYSLSLTSDAANIARGRLQDALSSPAKKITISPEIIIPEPSDPTALLLQSTEVSKMSLALRCEAKGNAAFLSGSINAIKTFCKEQESARGCFPGPLPVIYTEPLDTDVDSKLAELGEAGVSGILYSFLQGDEINSHDKLEKDSNAGSLFQSAVTCGIQLIPEVILSSESQWDESKTKSVIDTVIRQCGSEPVAILLTVGKEMIGSESDGNGVYNFPIVPKETPTILGSVRAQAGAGRIGAAVKAHKGNGFHGVILRCDCLPGYRMNPDLDFVQKFWGAAISDLKSTKSKSFNFRSKVALERDIPMEWFNYQKNVMESGALGGNEAGANPLDTENGDYQGF